METGVDNGCRCSVTVWSFGWVDPRETAGRAMWELETRECGTNSGLK